MSIRLLAHLLLLGQLFLFTGAGIKKEIDLKNLLIAIGDNDNSYERRCHKVALDLKQKLGDLKNFHVLEIGANNGIQCKVLAETTGFKSYTIIDSPQELIYAKEKLAFHKIENVNYRTQDQVFEGEIYDLVLSLDGFAYSEKQLQEHYLKSILIHAKHGYMTMRSMALDTFSIEDLIHTFLSYNKNGKIVMRRSNKQDFHSVFWKCRDVNIDHPKNTKCKVNSKAGKSAITYSFSGGRLGDNLVAYFHAKWLAFKYDLDFLYVPFPYADQFQLSDIHSTQQGVFDFQRTICAASEIDLQNLPEATLVELPYFPEYTEYTYPKIGECHIWEPPFQVDWDNPYFREEVVRCLQPKHPIITLECPKDILTVGVHVRKGGGIDHSLLHLFMPLKVPSDSYYIEQINRIYRIFNKELYVYLLTDDLFPGDILKKYRSVIKNPHIHFDSRYKSNGPTLNVLEDFFSISKFDCLIIPQSHFSIIASKIGDPVIKIVPTFAVHKNYDITIEEIELEFHNKMSK